MKITYILLKIQKIILKPHQMRLNKLKPNLIDKQYGVN